MHIATGKRHITHLYDISSKLLAGTLSLSIIGHTSGSLLIGPVAKTARRIEVGMGTEMRMANHASEERVWWGNVVMYSTPDEQVSRVLQLDIVFRTGSLEDSGEMSGRPKTASIRRRTATATIEKESASVASTETDWDDAEKLTEEGIWNVEKFPSPMQTGRLSRLEEREEDFDCEFITSQPSHSSRRETGKSPVEDASHLSWEREQSFTKYSTRLRQSLEEPVTASPHPTFSRTQSQASYDGLVMFECLQRSSALRVLTKAIDRHKDLAAHRSETLNLECDLSSASNSLYQRRTPPPRKLKPLFRGSSAN